MLLHTSQFSAKGSLTWRRAQVSPAQCSSCRIPAGHSSISTQRHIGAPLCPLKHAKSHKPATVCAAAYNEIMPAVIATPEMKFAIIVARFNDLVTKLLLNGAVEAFKRHGVTAENIDVVWVPGSFELPVVAKSMATSGQYEGVVCIGAIVKGATDHYDAVVSGTTGGLMTASVSTGVPVIFGVLTCDTMDQALDRAGGKVGNKGGEAAITAVEMANLMHTLREQGKAAPFSAQ